MAQMRKDSLKLTFLIVLGVSLVLCNDATFQSNFDIIEHLKNNFHATNDLNITNTIGEFMSQNRTENHECLIELNAIKNGIINFDEWAITRKFPSNIEKSPKTRYAEVRCISN